MQIQIWFFHSFMLKNNIFWFQKKKVLWGLESPSNFFCLALKITISVFFFTLSEMLFAFTQVTRYFNSALASLFSFLTELLTHNRLVSSAKWWTLQNFIAWLFHYWLYIIKIAGSLKQILEGQHSLYQQDQTHIHL